jgi:hypothetical protein
MELWRQRLRRDLSREDARQIIEDVTGFFRVLIEWAEAEPTNDNSEPRSLSSDAQDEKST